MTQAGTEGFPNLSQQFDTIIHHLIKEPISIPIPQVPGALEAWEWLQSQRKPFYIDVLHLTKGWSLMAEKKAQTDALIAERCGTVYSPPARPIKETAQKRSSAVKKATSLEDEEDSSLNNRKAKKTPRLAKSTVQDENAVILSTRDLEEVDGSLGGIVASKKKKHTSSELAFSNNDSPDLISTGKATKKKTPSTSKKDKVSNSTKAEADLSDSHEESGTAPKSTMTTEKSTKKKTPSTSNIDKVSKSTKTEANLFASPKESRTVPQSTMTKGEPPKKAPRFTFTKNWSHHDPIPFDSSIIPLALSDYKRQAEVIDRSEVPGSTLSLEKLLGKTRSVRDNATLSGPGIPSATPGIAAFLEATRGRMSKNPTDKTVKQSKLLQVDSQIEDKPPGSKNSISLSKSKPATEKPTNSRSLGEKSADKVPKRMSREDKPPGQSKTPKEKLENNKLLNEGPSTGKLSKTRSLGDKASKVELRGSVEQELRKATTQAANPLKGYPNNNSPMPDKGLRGLSSNTKPSDSKSSQKSGKFNPLPQGELHQDSRGKKLHKPQESKTLSDEKIIHQGGPSRRGLSRPLVAGHTAMPGPSSQVINVHEERNVFVLAQESSSSESESEGNEIGIGSEGSISLIETEEESGNEDELSDPDDSSVYGVNGISVTDSSSQVDTDKEESDEEDSDGEEPDGEESDQEEPDEVDDTVESSSEGDEDSGGEQESNDSDGDQNHSSGGDETDEDVSVHGTSDSEQHDSSDGDDDGNNSSEEEKVDSSEEDNHDTTDEENNAITDDENDDNSEREYDNASDHASDNEDNDNDYDRYSASE